MMIDEIIKYIRNKIGDNKNYKLWFEHMLRVSDIKLLNDLPDNHWYFVYTKNYGSDPNEYRAIAFVGGLIILHNNNETLESLSWILLHELGHQYCIQINDAFDYDLFEALSGGSVGNMSEEEYNIYMTNDVVHEARYEEQFVNNIATQIIGYNYDRHWWRKNCYKNKPEVNPNG